MFGCYTALGVGELCSVIRVGSAEGMRVLSGGTMIWISRFCLSVCLGEERTIWTHTERQREWRDGGRKPWKKRGGPFSKSVRNPIRLPKS